MSVSVSAALYPYHPDRPRNMINTNKLFDSYLSELDEELPKPTRRGKARRFKGCKAVRKRPLELLETPAQFDSSISVDTTNSPICTSSPTSTASLSTSPTRVEVSTSQSEMDQCVYGQSQPSHVQLRHSESLYSQDSDERTWQIPTSLPLYILIIVAVSFLLAPVIRRQFGVGDIAPQQTIILQDSLSQDSLSQDTFVPSLVPIVRPRLESPLAIQVFQLFITTFSGEARPCVMRHGFRLVLAR